MATPPWRDRTTNSLQLRRSRNSTRVPTPQCSRLALNYLDKSDAVGYTTSLKQDRLTFEASADPMAIKKSDLYSSLWASCDELRGGMDASQYKDYVLFMLFIKYVSDKYGDSDDFAPPVVIPKGASFKDMVALKGESDIGDKINTQVIQPLIDANSRLARNDFPDFDDPNKLGDGAARVERLSNLIATFKSPSCKIRS